MKHLVWILAVALFGQSFGTAAGQTAPPSKPSYLSSEELSQAISNLGDIRYPATQSEVAAAIGTEGRRLPVMGTYDAGIQGPQGAHNYMRVYLTDQDAPRHFILFVWFTPGSEKLSGTPFAQGRVVEYAEIILHDSQLNATFVAQSNRYPYRNLAYPSRSRSTTPGGAPSGRP